MRRGEGPGSSVHSSGRRCLANAPVDHHGMRVQSANIGVAARDCHATVFIDRRSVQVQWIHNGGHVIDGDIGKQR